MEISKMGKRRTGEFLRGLRTNWAIPVLLQSKEIPALE
jgi:hypothetical protein